MRYDTKTFGGMFEILSLKGNITMLGDGPLAHLHIVMAGPDYSAFGGHLDKAIADPTCEIALLLLDHEVRREKDGRTGLSLQRF